MRYVIVPGGGGSEPEHWQSLWERELGHQATRISPGSWTEPEPADWHDALARIATPDCVLIAHSLGCLASAAWLAGSPAPPVRGAFLVAAPDPRSPAFPAECAGFELPVGGLGVPALQVASTSDRFSTIEWSRATANAWNASLVEIPDIGHINTESGVGSWSEGRRLLTAFTAGLSPIA